MRHRHPDPGPSRGSPRAAGEPEERFRRISEAVNGLLPLAPLFVGVLFFEGPWAHLPEPCAREALTGIEIRFHQVPELTVEGEVYRCPSKDLGACLAKVFTDVLEYEEDGKTPVYEVPNVELAPLPRYDGKTPKRVAARIESFSACGVSGKCPLLILEERAPRRWHQVLYFHGLSIAPWSPSSAGDRPAYLALGHMSSFEGSYHLMAPIGDLMAPIGDAYRETGWEVHSGSWTADKPPCLLTPEGLSLLEEACPPLARWLRGQSPEGVNGWGPGIVEFQTDDVGMFEVLAQTLLEGRCGSDVMQPDETDGTFVVYTSETDCRPLFWSRGFAWRWVGGEWLNPRLDAWEQEKWEDAHREALDLLDLLKACPPGCQPGLPWATEDDGPDTEEEADLEEPTDAPVPGDDVAGIPEDLSGATPPPWASRAPAPTSCFQVLNIHGPGDVGVTWYGATPNGWAICDQVVLAIWDFQQ